MLRPLALIPLLALAGCLAPPTRCVALRVTSMTGEPVEHAQVYAVVLGRSPVPLPIDPETLEEIFTKETASGWTDEEGVVRLELDEDQSHVVFLRAPALGPYALAPGEAGAYRFLLEPEGDGLRADPVPGSETPTLRLETVR